MENFMVLIREDVARMQNLSESDMQTDIQEYTQWVEELAKTDNYVCGDPLEAEGRFMTKESVKSDGPFIESKEVITGYILLKAKSLEHAEQLAKGCPVFKYGGALELRQIMKY